VQRRISAMRIASDLSNVRRTSSGLQVRSESSYRRWYSVIATETEYSCTCPDFEKRQRKCKHIFAVELWMYGDFLPEPKPRILFDELGKEVIAALSETRHSELIPKVRHMMSFHRDLIRLNVYVARGLINSSYVADVCHDFLIGDTTLDMIEDEFNIG
jgi:hypothetical protein